MHLIFNGYFKNRAIRAAALVGALLGLSACVESEAPILDGGKPLLGERVRLRLYSLRVGLASDEQSGTFRWKDDRYRNAGGFKDVGDFTLHAFEGPDLIAQSRSKDKKFEYALVRKLAGGVFLVIPIDQDDADAATRDKFCRRDASASCRLDSKDALFAFARATAAKPHESGGLAVQLAPKS